MKLNPQTITLKKGNFKDACFYVVSVDHSFEITRLHHVALQCNILFFSISNQGIDCIKQQSF
jgi:hypothetical protein